MHDMQELWLRWVEVKDLSQLHQATQVKVLVVDLKNECDVSFLREMNQLELLWISALPGQREFIIDDACSKVGCRITFLNYYGDSISSEHQEDYLGFEITRYEQGGKVEYGVFQDLTEEVGKENNNEVETFIKKTIRKTKGKRKFKFDSEAGSFGVYAAFFDDLKWLIDQINELIVVNK